jgi:hypothetical protein
LAKRAGAFPKGHSEDPADAAGHTDTRQGDVGASGSTERPKPDDPGLEGSGAFPRDHGGDAVTKDAHPDPREHDIGASGSTSRE